MALALAVPIATRTVISPIRNGRVVQSFPVLAVPAVTAPAPRPSTAPFIAAPVAPTPVAALPPITSYRPPATSFREHPVLVIDRAPVLNLPAPAVRETGVDAIYPMRPVLRRPPLPPQAKVPVRAVEGPASTAPGRRPDGSTLPATVGPAVPAAVQAVQRVGDALERSAAGKALAALPVWGWVRNFLAGVFGRS